MDRDGKMAEMTRRGAAGLSKTTKGRSRVFQDKTKYRRRERTQLKGD